MEQQTQAEIELDKKTLEIQHEVIRRNFRSLLAEHGVLLGGIVFLFAFVGMTIRRLYTDLLHVKNNENERLLELLQQERGGKERLLEYLENKRREGEAQLLLEGVGSAVELFPDSVEPPPTYKKDPAIIRAAYKLIDREQRVAEKMRAEVSKRKAAE